jgi:mandelate racemase
MSIDQLRSEASQVASAGFGGYKMKIGMPDLMDDIDRVTSVREVLGDAVDLMVDANQGWDIATALEAGGRFDDLDIYWLEEPLDAEDIHGYALLTERLQVPIAAGETVFGVDGIKELIGARGADIVILDVARCGGPTGFLEAAKMAHDEGIDVTSHTFTEVSAHLMAACQPLGYVECVPGWWDQLWDAPPEIGNGQIHLKMTPGLGVNMRADLQTVEEFS